MSRLAVATVLFFALVSAAAVRGGEAPSSPSTGGILAEVSVEDILKARQWAGPKQYRFLPKQVVSVLTDKPPVVDGRLDDACWQLAGSCGPLGLLTAGGAPVSAGEPAEQAVSTGGSAPQGTEVYVCHAGGVLYVGFRAHHPAGARIGLAGTRESEGPEAPKRSETSSEGPEAPKRSETSQATAEREQAEKKEGPAGEEKGPIDSLHLYFSPRNDHTRYYRLVIDTEAGTRLFVGYALRGEFPRDRMTNEQELFRGPSFACELAEEEGAWTGEVAIPASALDLEGELAGEVWGFDVLRVWTSEPGELWAWSFQAGRTDVFPVEFGELFLGGRDVGVTEVDLGEPHWGDNTARLTVSNRSPGARKVRVLGQVFLPVEEVLYDRHEEVIVLAGGATRQLTVPYRLSWRGRWPVYAEYCQRLSFRLEDAESREPFYLTSYPVAFDVGVKPTEAYGEGRDAPRPALRDPEFVAKKRAYIVGRIPRFRRLGRAEGAESDFVLAAEDDSVRFDLMHEGVMLRIADWLFGRFDNDVDRMLGATYFVHQRSVTCHSGFLSGLGPMTSLSVLRCGGGLCDSRAQVLGSILSLMKCEALGKPYRTHCLGLKGHVVCAVEAVAEPKGPEDHWVLDPDVGIFYFTWDNSRFVTLGELRRDRGLSYRMNFNNVRHGHDFYFQTETQFTYDPEQKVVWPPEAPAW